MLRQDIGTAGQRRPRFDRAGRKCAPGGGDFGQLKAMGWHTQNAAGFAGPVIRPPGPLEKTRDSARTANLNHRIDTRKVDSQIETRSRNHAPHRPSA